MKQVLVTVGTTKFENLIKNLDNEEFYLLLEKIGIEKLIIQKGTGNYCPHKWKNLNLKNLKVEVHEILYNFENVIKSSEFVISHGGAGIILESLKNKKILFVAVNDQLMDNHQVELAESLYKDNYIFYLRDLSKAVEDIKNIIENKSKLTSYPEFNFDIIPGIIYEMLDI